MMRVLVIPLVLVGMLVGAVVWSGGGVTGRAEFTFINRGDIYTLDLNQMSYMQDFRLTYGIREGLYTPDSVTLRPVAAGAVGYDLSDDKKVWTFHLRKECKWSNGDPVTARDYVFSWRRMLEDPGEYTYLFFYVKGAEAYSSSIQKFFASNGEGTRPRFEDVGIKAVDDLTFVVTLNDPVPYLLELVAFPPFYPRHEKSMEPFAEKNQKTGQVDYRGEYTRPPYVVTNGAYRLTRWDFKRRLVLEKSDNYWDRDKVRTKSIEMVVTENPLSQFLMYDSGEVDWQSDVDGDLAAELRAQGRKDLRSSPAFGTAFLTYICTPELPASVAESVGSTKNPLADVRVRQALTMAIDKQFIVDSITRMGELPARTYLPPDGTLDGFTWIRSGGGGKARYTDKEMRAMLASKDGLSGPGAGVPHDVAQARQLLAEAGYPDGRGFPNLPILYGTNSETRKKICQVLKNQWKEALNVDVNIVGAEGKSFRDKVSNKEYAIAPVAWYGDYPDASTFTDKYLSTSKQNDCAWFNKAYDDLCAKASKEGDAGKRLRLLEEAENLLDTEVPIAPLYHYVNVSLSRDSVHGVDPNPRQVTVFKGVWVER
jgi:oligopeptide transport system substrate-binding protein